MQFNKLLVILLSLFSFCSCYAQKKITFDQPIVKGAKQTYQVKKSLFNTKIIQNINGHFYTIENHLPPNIIIPEPEDQILDKVKMNKICHEAFNDERLRQLVNDTKYMQVMFKTDLQGYIRYGFFIQGNLLINCPRDRNAGK
jgi:hypothetical protein